MMLRKALRVFCCQLKHLGGVYASQSRVTRVLKRRYSLRCPGEVSRRPRYGCEVTVGFGNLLAGETRTSAPYETRAGDAAIAVAGDSICS